MTVEEYLKSQAKVLGQIELPDGISKLPLSDEIRAELTQRKNQLSAQSNKQ